MSGGVAVGDYDNDGWPDMYFTRLGSPGVLYRNQHDGSFADVTAAAGLQALQESSSGAAWVDIDNDGAQDLFVTTMAGHRNYLFRNNGRGQFVDEAITRGLANEDGLPHVSFSVNVADIDGDGFLDIHTSEWRLTELATNTAPSHNRMFRNLGASKPGFFEDVTVASGLAMETNEIGVVGFATAITDLDADGHPDVVAVNDFSTGRLFWNRGNGTFEDGTKASGFGDEENGMGVSVTDFDGDGKPDIFVTSIFDAKSCPRFQCPHGTSGNRLYRNLGNRKFEDITDAAGVRDGGWGWGSVAIDTANTGSLDIMMVSGVDFPWEVSAANYVDGPTRLWRNAGKARFTSDAASKSGLASSGPGKGVAILDFDRDGRSDVVIARDGAPPQLFHNETNRAGLYVDIVLQGSKSPRNGTGARVEVLPRGREALIRMQETSGWFLSQDESIVHVGLGTATSPNPPVVDVVVRWPSGVVSRLTGVVPNRRITIREDGVKVPTSNSPGTTAQYSLDEAHALPVPAPEVDAALASLSQGVVPSPNEIETVAQHQEGMDSHSAAKPTLDASPRIQREMRAARAVVDRYPTARAAQRDGYMLASRFLPGIGAHWIRWQGVGEPFDATRPAMLLFDGNTLDAKLVGLSYFVRSAVSAPSGFADGNAAWHSHFGLCIVRGVLVAENITDRGGCDGGAGFLLPGRDLWMLHVWVVPGKENPDGIFAALNRALCTESAPCS